MKLRFALAAGAALILAACGSSEETAPSPDSTAPAEPTQAPDPAAAAAPGAGAAPTREFIVGKWGEDGDCALAIDFKADGSMDGPVDTWNYENGQLEMVGLPQKFSLTVVDDKTMESRADGKGDPHKLTRC